jgi:hypothetical protein
LKTKGEKKHLLANYSIQMGYRQNIGSQGLSVIIVEWREVPSARIIGTHRRRKTTGWQQT